MLSRRAAGLGLLALAAAPPKPASALYFLSGSRVMTAGLDGSNLHELAIGQAGGLNDGIAYDPVGGRLYWTNMGRASADDGFIQSVKLDGSDLRMVVPPGGTFTPKQLKIDPAARKLYWSDREGLRVMRADLDGSGIEVLVETGSGDADRKDQARWCVGIALDPARGHVYWTQKGGDNAGTGTIRRAALTLPMGQIPAARTDIEVLFSGLPEPIDLDLDLGARRIYWTDRGDNTISAAPMDRPQRTVLVKGLGEAIGLTLDLPGKRMFYTNLDGQVGVAALDGSGARMIIEGQRALTGIVLV